MPCGSLRGVRVVMVCVALGGCGNGDSVAPIADAGSDATPGQDSGSSGGGSTSSSGGRGSSSGSSGSAGSSGGSSGSAGSSSGASSSSSSGSTSGGGDAGIACPTAPCASGQVCCTQVDAGTAACAPSCGAGNSLECLRPGDCGGPTPDCCATVVWNGGTPPNCIGQATSTRCVAKCVSTIPFSCQATDTLHLCTQPSDCANDTANPNCCASSGHSACVSDAVQAFLGLTCK